MHTGIYPKKIIWKKPGDVNLEIAVRTISLTVGACSNTIPKSPLIPL